MKFATPIKREETGTIRDAYLSWAEQMLKNKVTAYKGMDCIADDTFEVVKETEKAVQIAVNVWNIFTDAESTWNIWMPKSAMVITEA